jgi:hypothetical protein
MALVGFVQAGSRFCLAYGLRGVFTTEGRRKLIRVSDAEALLSDKRKAWKIIWIVMFGSAIIAAIYYFFPGS